MPSPEPKAKIAPFPSRTKAPAAEKLGLTHRPRRNRKADWSRRLVQENVLTADDLIWPIFVIDGEKRARADRRDARRRPRYRVDVAVREAERAAKLGIPAIAIFPNIDPALRDEPARKSSTPTISSAAPAARSRRRCRRSASSPTSRSTPTPATAMTASCATATSSMTRRSRCWCGRR